jgi:PAS domain S-box-containing protein
VSPDGGGIDAILEAAPDGVVVVSGNGTITFVNARIEEMFGYTREEVLGQPVELLIPDEHRDAHRQHVQSWLAHPRARSIGTALDLTARRHDGTVFTVDISLSPVDGGVVAFVRDLGTQRQIDAGLGYLSALVASSVDAIYRLDREGRITDWSPAADDLFGYQRDWVIGRRMSDVVNESEAALHDALVEQVLVGDAVRQVELSFTRRDGLVVPVSISMAPVRDGRGRIIGVGAVTRDLTEQVLTRSSLQHADTRLREGETLAHVGGWVMDGAKRTVQWSDELYRIHGVTPATFDGSVAAQLALIDDADRERVVARVEHALATQTGCEDEYAIVRPDGTRRWVYARAEPTTGPGGPGLRGICQDITERRVAEEAMRHAYERERVAVEGLRAADALKDEFISTVSHELRTPLTSIIGFAHLLARPETPLEVADMASRIERNGREMLGMVERLLDFSRLQAGKVELRPGPVSLASIVNSSLDTLKESLADHPVSVSVPDDITVFADAQAVAVVMANLVSNAVKFSPPGTPIEIGVHRDGDTAVVVVRDHGKGIPPELGERVFERFFQAPGQPPGRRGAGVGLAIVRRYVELQGGRAWCDTPPGEGSRFSFSLPVSHR